MSDEDRYIYGDENGNTRILKEKDLPRCPRTGGIVGVFIIGERRGKSEKQVDHHMCRCEAEITCTSADSDFQVVRKG